MTKLRAILRRRWSVLVIGLVVGMLAGVLSSLMASGDDEATRYRVSQLIIANPSAPQAGNVEQDALRVTRGEVAQKASAKLAQSGTSSSSASVAATANTDSRSIEVTSTDTDAMAAQMRVQAYVNSFLEVVNADLTREQNRRLKDLETQVQQAEADLAMFDQANPNLQISPPANPEIAQALLSQRSELQNMVKSAKDQLQSERLNAKATLPYSTLGPDAPKVANSELLPVPKGAPFRAGLLGLLGLVLSAGLIMIVERLVPRIDTREELVDALDLPVLAEIGYFPPRSIPISTDGTLQIEGGWAEPYRRVRSAIQFVQSDSGARGAGGVGPAGGAVGGGRAAGAEAGFVGAGVGAAARKKPQVFMVTSASPGEGKSTTTAITALAMAETGERTLAVGGDFRKPSINKLLGTPQSPGIREHARLDVDRPTLDQIVHPTGHDELFIAPSGASGKEVVGLADAAKDLISEAVAEGATVLVDTSPVEVANDAVDLLPVVDYVILVVRSGRTIRKSLLNTVDQLQQHGARIMGVTLIGTPGLARQQYYYEGYYSSEPPKDDGALFPDPPVPPVAPTPGPVVEVIPPVATGGAQPVPAPVGVRSEALASQAGPPTTQMPPPLPVPPLDPRAGVPGSIPPLNPLAGAPRSHGSDQTPAKPWGAR